VRDPDFWFKLMASSQPYHANKLPNPDILSETRRKRKSAAKYKNNNDKEYELSGSEDELDDVNDIDPGIRKLILHFKLLTSR
jgi:hypothetical protein